MLASSRTSNHLHATRIHWFRGLRMRTQKQPAAPAKATHVDVERSEDVSYWTRILGVTELALRDAVKRVGALSGDVRAELRRRR